MPSIFLIGFMASGKTTAGRELARQLGLPFVDLDAQIERDAGMSIADIFAAEGEAGFRAREARALQAMCVGDQVVATGGGTPCAEGALERMRAAGPVVALSAPLSELLARVEDPSSRPLLSRPAAQTEALYAQRLPTYRQAHFGVSTEGRTVEAVVAEIRAGLAALEAVPASSLSDSAAVSLGERSYPIIVAAGALAQLPRVIEACGVSMVGIVTDDNVAAHYLARVESLLADAGVRTCRVVIPAGEQSKTLAVAGDVAEQLVAGGLDRASAVVALGGGVVGDLAGFVAATLFRGVRVVQVPTTLLAMIDSAIGGKTGVDLPAGKNLVGAFWQPAAVIADTDTLATLPARERRAAFGELLKYALLDGEALFAAAETTADSADVIRRCAAYKAWTVSRDERERTGERALLNLGHTVGHAIEAEAGYGSLLHGECVALGLIATCRVSEAMGLCDASLQTRVVRALANAGLDVQLDQWLRADVLRRIGVDKKRVGNAVSFVALRDVGVPELIKVTLDELTSILYDRNVSEDNDAS